MTSDLIWEERKDPFSVEVGDFVKIYKSSNQCDEILEKNTSECDYSSDRCCMCTIKRHDGSIVYDYHIYCNPDDDTDYIYVARRYIPYDPNQQGDQEDDI